MKASKYKALVLGVDERSALTVVRSLGRHGVDVHLGKDIPFAVPELSRYTRQAFQFPNAGLEPEAWVAALKARLEAERYDLVIPTVDKYLVPVIRHRRELEPLARLAIPDDRGFEYTYEKSKTLELARAVGAPCPRTEQVDRLDDLERIAREFKFPLIVKPVSSKVWIGNVRHDLHVELAKDRADLERRLRRLLPLCPVLIQSFHRGIGVGQEFLTRNGEVIAAFQHDRVHEPLGGGGSSYRKSAPLIPELYEASVRMLKELKWTGVAMVEYKYDYASREGVLIEINGRFWGSLPLPVAAGVDFPALLFDMLVLDKVPEKVTYRNNIYCRNLVNDFNWFKENLRADKKNPFLMTLPLTRVLGEVKNLLLLRERYDTLVWDDLRPGRHVVGKYIGEQFRGARDKLYHSGIKLNYRYNALSRRRQARRIRRLLQKNPSIAFVCKGNICRSPFAGYYFRQLNQNGKSSPVQVESYGLIERVNRPSPELAVVAARQFEIDMSAHRSRLLTAEIAEQAGVLFIMDFELYQRVKALFPRIRHKLFFLGVLQDSPGRPIEISDPYGKGIEQFKTVFKQIVQSVEHLSRLAKG